MVIDRMSHLWLLLLLVLSALIQLTASFSALPYVHIDFAHYFRLAQCQAKCTERYGLIASRNLLDGSQRRFFNVSSTEYLSCERGCTHGRLLTKKHTRSAIETAYKDGQMFWLQSESDNGTKGESPIDSVDVLCLTPAGESSSDFVDSFTAKVAAVVKADFIAPIMYIVQWKQIVYLESGVKAETKWITASIEKLPLIRVDQIQPGVFYQFQMTVVGPAGRMGKSVASRWLQTPTIGEAFLQPNSELQIKSQFNSDDGLSALVLWPSITPKTLAASSPAAHGQVHGLDVAPTPTACHFHMSVSKDTSSPHSEDKFFDRDESEGYLLQELEYSTNYSIKLKTMVPEDVTSSTWSLQTVYRSMSCQDVHGRGSLECDPEPVINLVVMVDKKNASALVSWEHAVDSANVLLYQLAYSSAHPGAGSGDSEDDEGPCDVTESSIYLSATATNAIIPLPEDVECDFHLKVIAFDLLGRDAVTTVTFHYTPESRLTFESLSTLWVVLGPAAVLLTLCLIIHCARCCSNSRSRQKKVGELMTKVPPENV